MVPLKFLHVAVKLGHDMGGLDISRFTNYLHMSGQIWLCLFANVTGDGSSISVTILSYAYQIASFLVE